MHLKSNPRKGACAVCHRTVASGKIAQTQMHHTRYNEKHPERHTVELCARDHARIHRFAERERISVRLATRLFLEVARL